MERQRGQQAHAVHLGLGHQGDAGVGGSGVEHPTERGAGGFEQEGHPVEFGEIDLGAVGEGVVGGGEEDGVLGEEQLGRDLGVVDGQVDHGEIKVAGEQLGEQ